MQGRGSATEPVRAIVSVRPTAAQSTRLQAGSSARAAPTGPQPGTSVVLTTALVGIAALRNGAADSTAADPAEAVDFAVEAAVAVADAADSRNHADDFQKKVGRKFRACLPFAHEGKFVRVQR